MTASISQSPSPAKPGKRQVRKRKWLYRLIACLIAVAVIGVPSAYLGYCALTVSQWGHKMGFRPPLWAFQSTFARIVADIRQGTLVPDGEGTVKLPSQYGGQTCRDEVIAQRLGDGRLVVLFPQWYGHGDDVQGFVYSTGPLVDEDYSSPPRGDQAGVLSLFGRSDLQARFLDSGWYWVVRREE